MCVYHTSLIFWNQQTNTWANVDPNPCWPYDVNGRQWVNPFSIAHGPMTARQGAWLKPNMQNFTWNLCDLRKNLLWTLYVLHMKFKLTSYEFHMKWNQIYSYEIHKKFIWTSYGVQMNFSWISYEIKSNLFTRIYMQFAWSSYGLHIEELMKLVCYTHVIQTRWHEAHKQFAWNRYEIHMNF